MKNSTQLVSAMLSAAAIILPAAKLSAATIAAQGFDSSAADTWNYTASTDLTSGTNYSIGGNVTSASETPNGSRVISGSSFQVQSTDNTTQTATLTFDSLNIAGKTGVKVNIPVAAISTTTGNGMDSGATGDRIKVFISLNGGSFAATPDLQVVGGGNSRWAFNGTGTGTITAGGTDLVVTGSASVSGTTVQAASSNSVTGTTDAAGPANLYINIPDGTTSFAMKIMANTNSTGEVWAMDSINVTATPEPAALGLLGVGSMTLLSRRRSNKR